MLFGAYFRFLSIAVGSTTNRFLLFVLLLELLLLFLLLLCKPIGAFDTAADLLTDVLPEHRGQRRLKLHSDIQYHVHDEMSILTQGATARSSSNNNEQHPGFSSSRSSNDSITTLTNAPTKSYEIHFPKMLQQMHRMQKTTTAIWLEMSDQDGDKMVRIDSCGC